MGVGHQHAQGAASKSLGVAFFLNLSFTAIEIVGGILTNSVAILSDAVHDAGDSLSLAAAWILQRRSGEQSDQAYTYGYARYSVLGALITGMLLILGLGYVLTQAVQRFASPEQVHAPGMLAIAVLGIVMNGIAALGLRGGASLNERVASWHLLEDVLGWVAVLIGAVVMMVWDVPFIDPVLSVLISLFVLWNVIRNLRQVAAVFLQRAPQGFNVEQFILAIRQLPGVRDVHHTHTWTLDGEHHVLTTHVVVSHDTTREQVAETKQRIRSMLPTDKFEHVTIDVEIEGEECASGHCHA